MASPCLLVSTVLCRWVADDAEQSGAPLRFCVRLQPQLRRLKSDETGEGLEKRRWMVRAVSHRPDSFNIGGNAWIY